MKERPILFSAPMVRALLAGTKTQTRRVVKLPHENKLGVWEPMRFGGPNGGRTRSGETVPEQGGLWHTRTGDALACPYGQPSDRLWVRETFADDWCDLGHPVQYRADGGLDADMFDAGVKWRPSIHMPRWASRITLEITGVRVERLQDISEADARAEGAPCVDEVSGREVLFPDACKVGTFRLGFRCVWESINGAGSWDANPWVWVVEFRRVDARLDALVATER